MMRCGVFPITIVVIQCHQSVSDCKTLFLSLRRWAYGGGRQNQVDKRDKLISWVVTGSNKTTKDREIFLSSYATLLGLEL